MKKTIAILLCAVMLLSVLSGCKKNSITPDNPTSPNQSGTPSASGNTQGGNNNGGASSGSTNPFVRNYDWSNFDPADFTPPLGDATFTVDDANSVTGEFPADGENPLTLSVTDGAGATWTLEIPAYALLSPESITMTVLRDVKMGGDDLDGGVQLSPDGLVFLEPATLTVMGNGCDEESVILEGGHDGKNMTFTVYETGDGIVTTTVEHFSIRTKARGKYGASVSMLELLIDMGNEVLAQPLTVPEPPSLTFKCPEFHNQNWNAVNDYTKIFDDPEEVARWTIKKAIANYRGRDAVLAQAMDVVMKLEERIADKVNLLIYTYKYQEDKFFPVAFTAHFSWYNAGKKGIDYEEIYTWGKEVWNELMQELVEKHNYTRAHSLTELLKWIGLFCGNRGISVDSDAFTRKLGNALTFRVEWEYKDALGTAQIITMSGEAVVSMNQISEKEGFFGEDAGVGSLDSYKDAVGSVVTEVNPSLFINNAHLSNLDPCMRGKITVGIDGFGEGVEITTFDKTHGDWSDGYDTSPLEPPDLFEDKLFVEGFYTFEFDLINLKENCVDDKYEVNLYGGSFVNAVAIKLFHQPKDDVFMR